MQTEIRTPMTVALAVARETGWDLPQFQTENGWTATGLGPVGRHRDSDALANSNFETILQDLQARFPNQVESVSFNHWAVGWVEEIAFHATPEILAAVADWRDRLDSYPVADEEDWSRREYEELSDHLETESRYEWNRAIDGTEIEYLDPPEYLAGTFQTILFSEYSVCRVEDIGEQLREIAEDLVRIARTVMYRPPATPVL